MSQFIMLIMFYYATSACSLDSHHAFSSPVCDQVTGNDAKSSQQPLSLPHRPSLGTVVSDLNLYICMCVCVFVCVHSNYMCVFF